MTTNNNPLHKHLSEEDLFELYQKALFKTGKNRRTSYIRSYKQLIKNVKETLKNNELSEESKLSLIDFAVDSAISCNESYDDTYSKYVEELAKIYGQEKS